MKIKQAKPAAQQQQPPVIAAPAIDPEQPSLQEALEGIEADKSYSDENRFHGKQRLLLKLCGYLHDSMYGRRLAIYGERDFVNDWYLSTNQAAKVLGVKWEDVARWLIEFREYGILVMTRDFDFEANRARRYRCVIPIRTTPGHTYTWTRTLTSGNVAGVAVKIMTESKAVARTTFSNLPTRSDMKEARQWSPWGEVGFGFHPRKIWDQLNRKT